jgi:uncharacterized delta-60 repeat protein
LAIFYNPRTITDGLVLCLDAANPKSYPGSGTTWFDLIRQNNNGSLTNGVGFDQENLGSLTFDGTNQQVPFTNSISLGKDTPWSLSVFYKLNIIRGEPAKYHSLVGSLNTSTPGWFRNLIEPIFEVRAVDIDYANEKIYVAGIIRRINDIDVYGVARLNYDGSIDSTFSTGDGVRFTNNIPGATVSSIKVASTGKIYIGGNFTRYNGTNINRIVRLNSDGTIDTSFNVGTGFNSTVNDIQEDSSGNIYVCGNFTTYKGTGRNKIVKIDSSGNIITAFNIGTGLRTGTSNATNTVFAWRMSFNSDQSKIYCVGAFNDFNSTSSPFIAAINTSNGTFDSSFNPGTGFNNATFGIAVDNDGKIYVGGQYTSYNGNDRGRICRLNSDGSLDTSFGTTNDIRNGLVRDIKFDNDGKLYVGGTFSNFLGATNNRIIRLNTDGTKDTGFDNSTGLNNQIFDMEVLPDNSLIAGGNFITYKSVSALRLIRINSDGTRNLDFDAGVTDGFYRQRFVFRHINASGVFADTSLYSSPFTSNFIDWEDFSSEWNNKWIYVVFTMSSDKLLRIYINSDLRNSVQYSSTSELLDVGFTATKIGVFGSSSDPLRGNISRVCIYEKELTQEEIIQEFISIENRYGISSFDSEGGDEEGGGDDDE